MKFAVKMALSMLAMLGVLFAIGGYYMLQQNFLAELTEQAQNHTLSHAQQKFALKRTLLEEYEAAQELPDYAVMQAGEVLAQTGLPAQGSCAVFSNSYAALFSNLPQMLSKMQQLAAIQQGEESYSYAQTANATYQLMASKITVQGKSFWLLSAFDVTRVFSGRARQLRLFWKLYAVLILTAAVLSAALAAFLTRPLRRLNAASRQITQGAYTQRIKSKRTDEIGQLSDSFDNMAQAVEEKVRSLELSVQQREDFVGAFTHELKTPMTAMLGYAALLQKENVPPQAQQKAIAYIHSETKRLESLSQRLLMLLGLSEEVAKLHAVKLADVFAAAQQAFAMQQAGTVCFQAAHSEVVLADAELLVDLLYNLVQNGLHASPKDGAVQVYYTMQEGCCCIAVHDDGKGIPESELARITEPFYRVDQSRARAKNSTGLGLAICARIAALHKTNLHFTSEVGAGTTVSFTLQAEEAAECD